MTESCFTRGTVSFIFVFLATSFSLTRLRCFRTSATFIINKKQDCVSNSSYFTELNICGSDKSQSIRRNHPQLLCIITLTQSDSPPRLSSSLNQAQIVQQNAGQGKHCYHPPPPMMHPWWEHMPRNKRHSDGGGGGKAACRTSWCIVGSDERGGWKPDLPP